MLVTNLLICPVPSVLFCPAFISRTSYDQHILSVKIIVIAIAMTSIPLPSISALSHHSPHSSLPSLITPLTHHSSLITPLTHQFFLGDAWSEIRDEFKSRAVFRMKEQLIEDSAIQDILDNLLLLKLMHFDHLTGAPTQVVSQLMLSGYTDNFDYFYQVSLLYRCVCYLLPVCVRIYLSVFLLFNRSGLISLLIHLSRRILYSIIPIPLLSSPT
jgi:hypothetical protein